MREKCKNHDVELSAMLSCNLCYVTEWSGFSLGPIVSGAEDVTRSNPEITLVQFSVAPYLSVLPQQLCACRIPVNSGL